MTIAKTVAVLDACVLYPPSLRDLLMWLSVSDVYQPRWTERINDEWTRNVLADGKATPEALARTLRLMHRNTSGAVVSDYEPLIPALRLPDPDDRHVLAAAIRSSATDIITFNLRHFPDAAFAAHGVRAVHPDPFLSLLLTEQPDLFLRAVRDHRASLRHPPKDTAAYLQTLRANGLHTLAQRLESFAETS